MTTLKELDQYQIDNITNRLTAKNEIIRFQNKLAPRVKQFVKEHGELRLTSQRDIFKKDAEKFKEYVKDIAPFTGQIGRLRYWLSVNYKSVDIKIQNQYSYKTLRYYYTDQEVTYNEMWEYVDGYIFVNASDWQPIEEYNIIDWIMRARELAGMIETKNKLEDEIRLIKRVCGERF